MKLSMSDIARIEDPLARLRAWADNYQAPACIEHAIRQLVIAREAPIPRVASVTPIPFAAPVGCTCGAPAPLMHAAECPVASPPEAGQ